MPKPRIDYGATQRFILVMMANAFFRDENMEFDPARIRQRLPVPLNLIKVCLISEIGRQQTKPVGVIGDRTVREWVGSGRFELTDKGRAHVEKMPDELFDMSLAALASGAAATVFQDAEGPDEPPPDKWEPLPIEAGDENLAAVERGIKEIADLVARDNGYKSEHPDERAEILSAFNGATTLLREASQVGYSTFMAYIVWPLEKLMIRFKPETIVGASAIVLREAVKDWLKARVGDAPNHILK
jgi:hypothetical protein